MWASTGARPPLLTGGTRGHVETWTLGHVGSVPRGSNQECFRNHEFFRAENKEALALRTAVADAALNDTLKFLREEGEIAIFDATNTTRARRQRINDMVKENGFKCLFLESVCDNQQLIEVVIPLTVDV